MTEDEARKRWCPFARSRSVEFTTERVRALVWWTANAKNPEPVCIGSDCMAWRWHHDTHGSTRIRNRHSYCGLAGEPKP